MERVKNWIEAGKTLFSLLRDLFLFIILLMLVGCPKQLKTRLDDAGVKWIHTSLFDWESETKTAKATSLAAAAAIDKSSMENTALLAQLTAAIVANPALAPQVAPIRAGLARSQAALTAAGDHLAASIATQQMTLRAANAETAALSGWIYLGTVDAARTRWHGTDQTTTLPWPITIGAVGRIDDDAYVRADGSGPTHGGAPFLGVASKGSTVRVDAIDVAPPLSDGRMPVWARVTVQ